MPRRSREEIEAILQRSGYKRASVPLPKAATLAIVSFSTLALLISLIVYRAEVRAYLGQPTAEDIYALCMSKTQAANAKVDDQLGKAMLSGMFVELCTSLRNTCNANPNGADCTKIKDIVTHMARSR